MFALDQERTVTSTPKRGTAGVGGQKSGGPASSLQSTTQRNLDATATGVANLQLGLETANQTQWLKDDAFRVHAFGDKAAQYYCP